MKLCTLAYCPPPKLAYAEPFLKNLRAHKPRHDLLLYSDHPWPDVRQLRGSPEIFHNERAHGRENSFALSNLVFFTGMSLAEREGYTHVLYVEADSRVLGEAWDDKIFAEFFAQRVPAVIGGTVVVHNPCTFNMDAARRWQELIACNTRRNYPIATFGDKGQAEKAPSCVFCLGSGTVIDLQWYRLLFSDADRDPQKAAPVIHQFGLSSHVRPVGDAHNGGADGFWPVRLARESRAWDVELGVRIWDKFGPDAFEVVAHLGRTVFSSYGDNLTSEQERLALLRDGHAVLVHQVKSAVEL